jgi:thiamine biosynthesis lipoprotein
MRTPLIIIVMIFLAGLGGVNADRTLPVRNAAHGVCGLQSPERFTFEEPHMGTTFKITLYAADQATAKKAADAAFARIAELNRILSDYLTDSELMVLCGKAGGAAVEVSQDLFQVLSKSDEVAKLTDGAFDVSISPVVRLWRKAKKTGKLPDPQDLKKALELVDFRKIKLDPKGRRVQLLLVGMLLDLGGIAKGYTADAALAVLKKHGIKSALVAAGGDIAMSDPPPDAKGWKITVAGLKGANDPMARQIVLSNMAVSTAGDLYQNVQIDGKRYSHIIDPKTGIGLVGRRSVTIIAPEGWLADGLDTAICVMGSEKGLKLIESLDKVAGIMFFETDKGVDVTVSKRFAQYEVKEAQ